MGAHTVDIGLRRKHILRKDGDSGEGFSTIRVEYSTCQLEDFLGPGLAEPVQEKNGAKGVEHVRDLILIGERGDVPYEHFPEVWVEARRQNKGQPETVLSLPRDLRLN